jgi:D-amino peptidase
MKILIAADMEGITGVVHWEHVDPNTSEYQRFRKLMTDDVNAAIRGAFAGGADEVVVADGHNNGRNILIEELDSRAKLNSGSPSPLSMINGIDKGVDGLMFVGYHARSGAQNGNLDHTWSDERVFNIWINRTLFGESELNGAVAGHFGVPLIMVSGDQTVCAECRASFGAIETAIVKTATSRMAAELLPPAITAKLIESAAQKATLNLDQKKAPKPLIVPAPITLTVEFVQSEMADKASIVPGSIRREDRKVEYTADDMVTIYRAFRSMVMIAR